MDTIITAENYDKILDGIRSQSIHERDTQTVFRLYFFHEKWDESRVKKTGSSLDNPRIYEYEIAIGKKLFEMGSNELLDLFLINKRNKKKISQYTYRWLYSTCVSIWGFYIEHISNIRNPWARDEMQPNTVSAMLAESKNKITTEDLEEIIIAARNRYYDIEHYEYGELIVRLLYDGIPSLRDIIEIKESQINFQTDTIDCMYRIVHISERTRELLIRNHDLECFSVKRQSFYPVFYKGSYIPLLVKRNYVDSVDDRSMDIIFAGLSKAVNKFLDGEITTRDIYRLGFYDFVVNHIGYDNAYEIITNSTQENTAKLMSLAGLYGYNIQRPSYIRSDMKEFL